MWLMFYMWILISYNFNKLLIGQQNSIHIGIICMKVALAIDEQLLTSYNHKWWQSKQFPPDKSISQKISFYQKMDPVYLEKLLIMNFFLNLSDRSLCLLLVFFNTKINMYILQHGFDLLLHGFKIYIHAWADSNEVWFLSKKEIHYMYNQELVCSLFYCTFNTRGTSDL